MNLAANIFISTLLLQGCTNDFGFNYTIEEKTEIIGEIQIDSSFIYRQAVDILFVVDESCSMVEEQDDLQNTMPTIYNELVGPNFTDLDWRVGIKSADPNDGGIYSWVNYDDPNPTIGLMSLTSLLKDHQAEAGLDSAMTSIGFDSGFHREESDLLIVFISDEPDQSVTFPSPIYESTIQSVKSYPFIVTESSIIVTYTGESRCDNASIVSSGYPDVSEITVDLCDTQNWVKVLDFIKRHVPTLNERFELTKYPISESTIDVYADGVIWNDWTYNAEENVVYLTVTPEVDSLIQVAYLY